MENEIWLTVPGWPEYEVSDAGRVKSLPRYVTQTKCGTTYTRLIPGRIRSPSLMNGGAYMFVSLANQMGKLSTGVHRLVASAFLGPAPSSKHQVAHKDGNGLNNRVDNLRWATAWENNQDKFLHGTVVHGERHHSARISDEVVRLIIDRRNKTGLSHWKIGREFGVSTMHVWRLCAGERRATALASEIALNTEGA